MIGNTYYLLARTDNGDAMETVIDILQTDNLDLAKTIRHLMDCGTIRVTIKDPMQNKETSARIFVIQDSDGNEI